VQHFRYLGAQPRAFARGQNYGNSFVSSHIHAIVPFLIRFGNRNRTLVAQRCQK
jgi:hypothetical protein